MSVRVAINGFGRIGRNVLRAIAEAKRSDIEVIAINDLAPVETNAHLLRFDSVHGRFPGEVTVKGDTISLGNGAIKVTAVRDPATLPWKDLGVDIALECTGIFTSKDKAAAHLTAGAKRVIISAPADGVDLRVPTPNVSVIDFKFVARRATSKDEINNAVKRAAEQQLKGILGYTEAPNVSSDFNHDAHSSVFAIDQTKVMDGTLVRVMSWYDNEWGFSNRMVDTAVAMGKLI